MSVMPLRDTIWTGALGVNSHLWCQDFSVPYRAKRICAAVCCYEAERRAARI